MKTLIEKMDAELEANPQLLVAYRMDFDHDQETLSREYIPDWIWIVRRTGTHLWPINVDPAIRGYHNLELTYLRTWAAQADVAPKLYRLRISRRTKDGRIYGDIVPITWDEAMMLLA